ncbi:hypothetical protein [Spirillospora sp. CA-128828]|uniref:hypothetical protein n=1 Tax=Spirillospora sp. CA-128828 TaxID=3240033 RepID=UPI003D91B1A3
MSTPESIRALAMRALCTLLAWLVVILSVFGISMVLATGSPNNAMGMITAATNVTALLFLGALRVPRVRGIAGNRKVGWDEIVANWSMFREEILKVAIFPTVANLFWLTAFNLLVHSTRAESAENWPTDMLIALPLMGVALDCYFMAWKTILSMRRKAVRGGRHHPALGVVLGSLLTAPYSLLALALGALASAITWQVLIPCAIAGTTTFFAALITLRAVPAAKN